MIFAGMNLFAYTIKEYARRPLAAFMAIWLSGFVFLLCCDMANGAPPEAPVMSHCHKAKQEQIISTSASVSDTSIDCCSILPAVFDKSRRVERTESVAATSAEASSKSLPPAVVSIVSVASSFYSPPLPDLHKSYIRNRVLRI